MFAINLRSAIFLFTAFFMSIGSSSVGQTIDSLKLVDTEIPVGYQKIDELTCVTPHAYSLFKQTGLYESFLGKLSRKEYQSFGKKGDKGSILYFEFENAFSAQGFLNGLLWGEGTKPSKSEPDEYLAKGNFLIVWSFNLKSEIKAVSKAKVIKMLADIKD